MWANVMQFLKIILRRKAISLCEILMKNESHFLVSLQYEDLRLLWKRTPLQIFWTAWKVPIFVVFLFQFFPYSDWLRTYIPQLLTFVKSLSNAPFFLEIFRTPILQKLFQQLLMIQVHRYYVKACVTWL